MQRIYYFIYQSLLYLALPFILLRLFWRGFKQPQYRQRWRERLGFQLPAMPAHGIWIHAVSVGEVIATRFLVEKLRQAYPDSVIIITTMTPTGSAQVKKLFQDTVYHTYVPYDYPAAVNRFLTHVKPRVVIMMETELWPTIYMQIEQQKIPIILANARLSVRSFSGYQKLKFLIKPVLQNITLIAAQTKADAERFMRLGANPARVTVLGSIKFDIVAPTTALAIGQALRASWGERPVWIAASTHIEEEAGILNACITIQETIPNALCIIVPRHPERFQAVWQQCQHKGLQVVRRSQGETVSPDTQIYLGDTLGELFSLYAASDVTFVGGSFSNTGGHNILEPAVLHLPIIVGPNMFNFAQITQLFLEAQACVQLADIKKLPATIIDLLEHPERRKNLGDHAAEVVTQHQGALDRLMVEIGRCM